MFHLAVPENSSDALCRYDGAPAAAVRCCHISASNGSCAAACAAGNLTSFEDAVAACAAIGRRPCARAELEAGACDGEGCAGEPPSVPRWALEACSPEAPVFFLTALAAQGGEASGCVRGGADLLARPLGASLENRRSVLGLARRFMLAVAS